MALGTPGPAIEGGRAGWSSKDFGPALDGSSARMRARAFADRDLSGVDYVYLWADGIHLNVRLEQEKLCLLVMISVRVADTKQLVALTDGYREAAESWVDLAWRRPCRLTDDLDELLRFYDYPAEHWIHLRTTNPIESTFAAVRHRTKVTKGPGSKAAGIAMAYKLVEAQGRWRAVNAPHLVAPVRAGARFEGGKLVERPQPAIPHGRAA